MGYIQLLGLIMGKIQPFRYWYYLRQGYQLYFAFIFTGINTMVITYFLAIERAPFLKQVFPSFLEYAVVMISIGIPVLVLAGFIHFKKIPAFKSEQEVTVESNPYIYKLPPGHARVVGMPWTLMLSDLMLKLFTNEKITDEEIKKIKEIQKNMKKLIEGEYVGIKKDNKLPFHNKDEEKN